VPAVGFYEWKGEGSERRRYWITLVEGGPSAGLWTRWYDQANSRVVRSFAIITIVASELCASLTDRMPVILDPVHYSTWLGEVPAGRSRLPGRTRSHVGRKGPYFLHHREERTILMSPAEAARAAGVRSPGKQLLRAVFPLERVRIARG
jgi:hypothetical protein